MGSIILILSFLACVNSLDVERVPKLFSDNKLDFGPIKAKAQIKNLTEKYEPLSSNDIQASASAKQLVELLRRMFPYGIGVDALPPLDPYTVSGPYVLPNLVIQISPLLRVELQLDNLVLTGAQAFTEKHLEIRLNEYNSAPPLRLDVMLFVPQLNVSVSFEGVSPFLINGKATLVLDNLSLAVGIQSQPFTLIGSPFREVFQNTAMKVNAEASNAKLHLWDIKSASGSDLKKVLDTTDAVNSVLDHAYDTILLYMAQMYLQNSNHLLVKYSAEQVMAYLLPDPIIIQ